MNQLAPADVANLRCRFVSELYAYTKCLKYSLSCCRDKVLEAFLNYKAASKECTLADVDICRLKSYETTSAVVSCSVSIDCANQAVIDLKITEEGGVYTPTILDGPDVPIFSKKAYITLLNDSVYQNANVTVALVDQYLDTLSSAQFSTGSALVGNSIVTDSVYSMKAYTFFSVDNIQTIPNGYIKTIRIYYTDALGAFVPGQFWDINVSPVDSPYLTCGTCDSVTFSDLFFTSGNWEAAIKTTVDNAIRDLTGDVNIDFWARQAGNVDLTFFASSAKHNPTSTWCSMNHQDLRIEYFNGAKPTVLTQSSTFPTFLSSNGNMYGSNDFAVACGTKNVSVGNKSLYMSMDASQSRFNFLKLTSSFTADAVTINDTTPIDCTSSKVTATVTSGQTITLVEWLNDSEVQLATGFVFYPNSPGDYICRVTLDTGCELTKNFTVT